VNLKKSWVTAHPRVVIGFILVVCLGPFLNKAIHTDDVLFVWSAEWIQKHPADFFGFKINWWMSAIPMWVANYNPPLMSYFLAGAASVFGWSEIALHFAGLIIAITAALGIYSLARMWCGRPLLATMVAIFTPAFMVSSTTLMCDVLMLSFWIWAMVLWERALRNKQSRWQFIAAGALAGLAVLTKYSAITLLPLLPILSLLRTRRLGWWVPGIVVPVLMLVGYELITARMYGRGLFFAAVHYAQTGHIGFPGGWKASGIIGLAFAGGSLLPVLLYAPFIWRPKTLLAGGIIILGTLLLTFRLSDNLGLMGALPDLMKHWGFLIQCVILTASGIHLFLFVAAEAWRRRDAVTITLVLWIIGVTCFATILNWTVNVRSFLPLVPAAAILLVRRLEAIRGNSMTDGWLLWPLIPAAAVTLSIAVADYQLANSARTVAEQITLKYKSAGHQLWFEGHGAFQYYMEKLGGRPIDVERSLLLPNDIVVVPYPGTFFPLPAGSVGWADHLEYEPSSWMNLMGGTEKGTAGFYGANLGPVPFSIGKPPVQLYYFVRVDSRIQYDSKPDNEQEAQAGDLPSFSRISSRSSQTEDVGRSTGHPEVAAQVQLAIQLDTDGKTAEAITKYRNVLSLDSNNLEALNNLAFILATADKSGLRNGEEAVQFAAKAVELTRATQPKIIGTLGMAYAQAGYFPQACEMARVASVLASLTNQKEIAFTNAKLLSLYSSGRTADAADAK